MIPLATPVDTPPLPLRIDMQTRTVSLGSCFADEVASRMLEGGLHVLQNPFGTLYNPLSIANALDRLIDAHYLTDADLVQHDGLWHSWLHHGSFSRPTRVECLALCNAAMAQARQTLAEADLLLLTFGTAWVFELVDKLISSSVDTFGDTPTYQHNNVSTYQRPVVSNCHKLPASCFERRRLSVDEIVAAWQPLLQKLHHFNPRLQVLFTVSPIRHKADGMHGNQLSKATLLLAIDQLLATDHWPPTTDHWPPTTDHYFPAYEIVLDELRDYRFYAPDMLHPSPLAVEVVWQRLCEATMSAATRQQLHNKAKAARASRHIPLHP